MSSEVLPGEKEAGAPPGPRGFTQIMRLIAQRRRDPLGLYLQLVNQYGDLVYFRVGRIGYALVSDPDCIQHVLQTNASNYVKGPGYERLRGILGNGLITSEGEQWRFQRRLTVPEFHQGRIAASVQDVVRVTREMMAGWETPATSSTPVDLADEMSRVTLKIVSQSLLGSDPSARAEEVRVSVQNALNFSDGGGIVLHRLIDILIPARYRSRAFRMKERAPLPGSKRFMQSVGVVDDVVGRIVADRRRSNDYGNDLLGAFMKAQDQDNGSRMNDTQLRDAITTILIAGHETTATALTWTWHLLDENRAVAAKMREEIDRVIGDRDPGFEDVAQLRYTHHAFEEALRYYPPVWRLSRVAIGDDAMMGFRIPAGTVVIISPYVTHRSRRFWANPETFNPDRFETATERPRFVYIPFGAGQRYCVGANFVFMEAIIVLALVARRWSFTPIKQPFEYAAGPTLRPAHGLPVLVSRRELA